MWRLGKPALDSALQDIDKIIRASGNRLDDTIKPKMQYVIRMYDQKRVVLLHLFSIVLLVMKEI